MHSFAVILLLELSIFDLFLKRGDDVIFLFHSNIPMIVLREMNVFTAQELENYSDVKIK